MSQTRINTFFGALLMLTIAYTGTCQDIGACKKIAYLSGGKCVRCPENCATCISDTNCTKCTDNSYGPICQHACEEECTDQCHRKYGYCTYGCVDGRFPAKDSGHCPYCPSHCTLCKSSTECLMCHPGHHGNTCEHPCENHCVTCDQESGNCTVCAEGYFNKYGRCNKCPDGCVGCFDNKNCSVCKDRFLKLLDGQCVMECPRDEGEMHLSTNGLYSFDFSNRETVKNACLDTGSSHGFSYKTTAPCILTRPCPAGHDCSVKDTGTGTCAAIMSYKCIHVCQPLNRTYHECEPNCSTIKRKTHNWLICLSSLGTISVDDVSTKMECLQASTDVDTGSCLHDCHKTVSMPLLVVLLVALCMLMVVIFIILYRRRRLISKDTRQEDTGATSEILETGLTEQHQPNMIPEAESLINKQKRPQEPTYTINTEEITGLDDNAAECVETRTKPPPKNTPMIVRATLFKTSSGNLETEPYQQNTHMTPGVEPLKGKQKINELGDYVEGFMETRTSIRDTKLQHSTPLIRKAKLIIKKQDNTKEPIKTMKTEKRPELANNYAGFMETRTDTVDEEPLMNMQEHAQGPLDNMVSEKTTELNAIPKGFTETKSDNLETEPYQQNTHMTPGVEPLKGKQKITELGDNVEGFMETRTDIRYTRFQHNTPLIRDAKLIIKKQDNTKEPIKTLKTEKRPELANNSAGFMETRTDTVDEEPLMNMQEHAQEPLNNMVSEKTSELNAIPKGFTETKSDNLETEPYQQNTHMMPGVEPLKGKQEKTEEPTYTNLTEDQLRRIIDEHAIDFPAKSLNSESL